MGNDAARADGMDEDHRDGLTRRVLLQAGGAAAAGLTVASGTASAAPAPVDVGRVGEGGKVEFPPWTASSERPAGGPPNPDAPDWRVGFAIVGLGRLAVEEIIPAFGEAKYAKLAALVSGTPDKAAAIARQCGIKPESIYTYQEFDRIRDNPEVDVVYIVLPNNMHREYVVRTARAGKHVLCEKPMATSSAECREMIDACRQAGRKLMIAYRCQYEPHHRTLIRMTRERQLGAVKLIEATNTQNMGDPEQWRLKRAMAGGGSLPDIGIYCLSFARYVTGEEPVEVFASIHSTPNDARFREVEETVEFLLRFPSGVLAKLASSYGLHEARRGRVYAEQGWIDLDPAFAYEGLRMRVGRREGRAESIAELRLAEKNQFALELDHMAECVRGNREPHTPGEEGLQDHLLMEAIYESARTGRPVSLPRVDGRDVTRGPAPPEKEQGA
jgi:predicted dehydrogenase